MASGVSHPCTGILESGNLIWKLPWASENSSYHFGIWTLEESVYTLMGRLSVTGWPNALP